ncbi:GAP family protein [Saccharomonospora iraqiensis]|uniref:GAP family protein n=1 Tax=Saccharomonospora iraqiensis TaxID=52698 RepID=UPI00022E754B|nr:GAP family protein [Saccharomonospora iraqiensis]
MGQVIGQVLSLGVGVALSPLPIIAVVLLLTTPRARSTGPAFLTGWVLGPTVVGTIVLLVAQGIGPGGAQQPADWVSVLHLVLGVALVGVAAREWRHRPRGTEQAALPRWMRAIETVTPLRAGAFGATMSSVNPKNLLLVVSAAAAIARTGATAGGQAVALAVFVVLAAVGTATPVALYFALGERANHLLAELKLWMGRNSSAITAVVCLVLAAKLVGDAVSGLSG